jgi:hypothetical protein
MKKRVYQWFSSLLTFIYVLGALPIFLSYRLNFPHATFIRWLAVMVTPTILVILNVMMNLWMLHRGTFNRKLQAGLYATVIYSYNVAITYSYIEGNETAVSMDMIKIFITSFALFITLSLVSILLGVIADKTYKRGWFVIASTSLGLISILSGILFYHMLINL